MRNGLEVEKEWRRWRSFFFEQKIECVFMDVPSSSYDILPCPSDNFSYLPLNDIFSFKANSSNYLSSSGFLFLNFPYNFLLEVSSLINASLISIFFKWVPFCLNKHLFSKFNLFPFLKHDCTLI